MCSNEMPLQPQLSIESFGKWGLDFVGPINPPFINKYYSLAFIDNITTVVEVMALKHAWDTYWELKCLNLFNFLA